MKFGIFDHIDDAGVPLGDLYADRLTIAEAYDRAGFYGRAQEVAHEEAPWIPIAHSVRFDPVRKEVIGYKMDATAHHYFDKVDLADK